MCRPERARAEGVPGILNGGRGPPDDLLLVDGEVLGHQPLSVPVAQWEIPREMQMSGGSCPWAPSREEQPFGGRCCWQHGIWMRVVESAEPVAMPSRLMRPDACRRGIPLG